MQTTAQILFPEIIRSTTSPHAIELTLLITENLSGFTGHFANNPILPGIVQVQWAVHFANEYLQMHTAVMAVEKLKFTHIIHPSNRVKLSIQTNTDKKTARFRFDSYPEQTKANTEAEAIAFSQGQLIYA